MENMNYCKVTAFIRSNALEQVEHHLRELVVSGISVTQVKGYGEYANYYAHEGITSHARVEIFIAAKRVEAAVQAIMDAAHTGLEGDGIVVVQSVSKIYRIRHRAEVRPGDPEEPLNR
ncbi:MAG: P-II family nitrogen regulator [Georgfuchsia sp.]